MFCNQKIFGILRPLKIAVFFFGLFGLGACQIPSGPCFEREVALKNGVWHSSFQPTFTLNIKDTAAHYQTYILLRQDNDYPFANIWLRFKIQKPGDTTFSETKRINLALADVSGAWLGRGMGSIWEHKIPLGKKEKLKFKKPGTYRIRIEQIMRNDPLKGILNVGLIVRKPS